MEQDFYLARLRHAGLTPILPDVTSRARIHHIIYDELCRNRIRDDSRMQFEAIAADLALQGADSLILGCTEIGMLLNTTNVPVPVFDSTLIHCETALDLALSDA
ncbi:MAG: aspartate/glutamate racemase family protein [Paracoccus sp. (in: a-proteobacteria)]|nr:aspartate/glutamate racemase family protein [Paracoccus sp. (in: a-proteobacteria)]MDO5621347.1 aspartate/glutamate racemase family protein [Paracoccus sp. (in: a-proteobacteria)]